MNQDSRMRLRFEPVDFVPLAGISTMYNRNHAKITHYPLETLGGRAVFSVYQILSTGGVLAAGLYVLSEKF